MKLIARNNRMYTITDDISQVFWNAWETDKQSLKSQGYSIFKRDNKIYLSHFEDTIATEEECIAFNKLWLCSYNQLIKHDFYSII